MNLAGTQPLPKDWFGQLRGLMDRFAPAWVSDHLCWTQFAGHHFHDLLPFPLNNATLQHVAERVEKIQELLGQPILVENVSTYVSYLDSNMDEADFLRELCRRTGCYMLLDVNNIYVSATNNGFDPSDYLARVPADRVKQIHLAGFEDTGKYLLDSHSAPVWPQVWALYSKVVADLGPVPTLIEWDNQIPELGTLLAEAATAKMYLDRAGQHPAVAQSLGEQPCL
jgi:uncharacterized protein (UPF0276 family)